jgi:hypothetical protein
MSTKDTQSPKTHTTLTDDTPTETILSKEVQADPPTETQAVVSGGRRRRRSVKKTGGRKRRHNKSKKMGCKKSRTSKKRR